MCNECVAIRMLDKDFEVTVDGVTYQAKAKERDKGQAFKIRKKGDKWGKRWISTRDLALEAMRLGFDVKRRGKKGKVSIQYLKWCLAYSNV